VGGARSGRVGSGRAVTCAAGRVDHACALFGFVAAVDVVAAQFDLPTATRVVVLLGTVAVVAWVVLLIRMTAVVHTRGGWAAIRAGARGSWLLVVVATQSLVLTAARLGVVAGEAAGALVAASVVGWLTGVLAYLVIVPLVVRRTVAARMAPALLTPDAWVLMGAGALSYAVKSRRSREA
jgi:tellurite resistance protein TehA-like permease